MKMDPFDSHCLCCPSAEQKWNVLVYLIMDQTYCPFLFLLPGFVSFANLLTIIVPVVGVGFWGFSI